MNIKIPSDAELWEVVAAIQVCQSQGATAGPVLSDGYPSDALELDRLAGLDTGSHEKGEYLKLNTTKAYREINSAKESYQAVLARVSGLPPVPIAAPRFPLANLNPSTGGGIIVCAQEVNEAFKLSWRVWRPIVRHLRSYGRPVRMLGQSGERMDYATFTEGQILSDLSMMEKLEALASADLVVGVPNAWTWIATAWKKKILVMHPDDVPAERWFGFDVAPRTLGRLLYTSSQLQVPVILAGLRRLIEVM